MEITQRRRGTEHKGCFGDRTVADCLLAASRSILPILLCVSPPLCCISDDHPSYSLSQNRDVEVQNQPRANAAESEICEKLRFVYRHNPLNGFQFDDHRSLYNYI